MTARSIHVSGIVQGVGFRPFVYRLAQANAIRGWALNAADGLELFVEGTEKSLQAFLDGLTAAAPQAARIASVVVNDAEIAGHCDFTIRESRRDGPLSVRVAPDLPVCQDCLRELFDPRDPRYLYPYINCSNCGPRYSVIEELPYDRRNTTMRSWSLDQRCAQEYGDPADRRFHAQPLACPNCGPHYTLGVEQELILGDAPSICRAAELLREGKIVAVKGLGGYHLACDAANAEAIDALRERKFRKERPFAVMARDVETARSLVRLPRAAEDLLTSVARPIVLAAALQELPGIAPDNGELGVMLPHAPLHYLLFEAGAPDILVVTSANRSSEPIAYEDSDALMRLDGIADAFLIGERPIARRVEDSVARVGPFGPMILRRSRGYAPGAVATLPVSTPILSVGADLKNAVALAVEGQIFVSQHIGDLEQFACRKAFQETIADLTRMYGIEPKDLTVAHDLHPQYVSTLEALNLNSAERVAVQHHRAHIASVIAERQAWDQRVVGVAFDGTGYGDDGTIWGGEFFAGSLTEGFERLLHLRPAALPGGDAAARRPIQAAAGFLDQLADLPDFCMPPFQFPNQYRLVRRMLQADIRSFETTSVGRLFDAAAALLGFTRDITFEGQAAIWLEHLARQSEFFESYPFPINGNTLDFRLLLERMIEDRLRGLDPRRIARSFQRGFAEGVAVAIRRLCRKTSTDVCVLSGGVFQNQLLLEDLRGLLDAEGIRTWTNSLTPANDGGICLGQAAIAAFQSARASRHA